MTQVRFMPKSRGGVGYKIAVGHFTNPFLKSGRALCYQPTKKRWGRCPYAPTYSTTPASLIRFGVEKLVRYLLNCPVFQPLNHSNLESSFVHSKTSKMTHFQSTNKKGQKSANSMYQYKI